MMWIIINYLVALTIEIGDFWLVDWVAKVAEESLASAILLFVVDSISFEIDFCPHSFDLQILTSARE